MPLWDNWSWNLGISNQWSKKICIVSKYLWGLLWKYSLEACVLCPDSALDTFWTPQNEEGQYILLGLRTSEIRFDGSTWKLKSLTAYSKIITTASSDNSYHSFLLGKSSWIITNDTSMNINFENVVKFVLFDRL